jgi:Taurine catabolism dioxygenase TauD, TfdA family
MSADLLEVEPSSVPGQRMYCESVFPQVLVCRSADAMLDEAVSWVRSQRNQIAEELKQSGTILFRDFPLVTDRDFDEFIRAFDLPNFRYEDSLSNAVRMVRTKRVFTANEAPPEVTIFFHHEMAQTPIYPGKLFFFCEHPAAEGGATPLCRSDVLFERLQRECPEFARDCEDKGLLYHTVMPGENDPNSGMGRSWQSTFRAETRDQAEQRMRELNYTWEWLDDNCVRATTPVLPAVFELPDGRKTFFNQLIAAYQGWKDKRNDPSKAITFGDGTPLDREAVMQAIAIAEELAFDVPWQAGDVALVDNYLVMHGRRTFSGTRRVLASLVAVEM